MAILIGVIALAVIPNNQRSRESKDIEQLDSLASATNVALANIASATSGTITIDLSSHSASATGTGASDVLDAIENDIGDIDGVDLGAGCASAATSVKIVWSVDATNGTTSVSVAADPAVTCNYTTKEDGTTKQTYEVSTGKLF